MDNLILEDNIKDYKSPYLTVKIVGYTTRSKDNKVFPILGVVYDVEKNINVDEEGIVLPNFKLPTKYKLCTLWYDIPSLTKGLEKYAPPVTKNNGLSFYWNYSTNTNLKHTNKDLEIPFFINGTYGLELDAYPICKDFSFSITSLVYHMGTPTKSKALKDKYKSINQPTRKMVLFLFDTKFLRVAYDSIVKTPTSNVPLNYEFDTIKPYDEVFNSNTDKYHWLKRRYKILFPWD